MSVSRANHLLEVLRSGDSLPDELRRWLVRGLEGWKQGRDLEGALQLDALPMPLSERDRYIRLAITMAPGESLAARFSYFVECICWDKEHRDPAARRLIALMQSARCSIPTSHKQLRRIVQNRRCDGWRYPRTDSRLCPSPPPSDDDDILKLHVG